MAVDYPAEQGPELLLVFIFLSATISNIVSEAAADGHLRAAVTGLRQTLLAFGAFVRRFAVRSDGGSLKRSDRLPSVKNMLHSTGRSFKREENGTAQNLHRRAFVDASQESRARLILQPVAGLEEPGNDCHAEGEKAKRDRQAQFDMYVGDIEKAPAEARDQIEQRIEQRDRAPE